MTWCTPWKISTHHWVRPRKSVSNRAPHLLTPALGVTFLKFFQGRFVFLWLLKLQQTSVNAVLRGSFPLHGESVIEASSNSDHMPWSIYYCLDSRGFYSSQATLIFGCGIWRTYDLISPATMCVICHSTQATAMYWYLYHYSGFDLTDDLIRFRRRLELTQTDIGRLQHKCNRLRINKIAM